MKFRRTFLFFSFTISLFSQVPPPVQAPRPDTEDAQEGDLSTPQVTQQGDSGSTVIVNDDPDSDTTIYPFAEIVTLFPGGDTAFKKYISDSLRHPKPAHPVSKETKSYVQFTVEKDGSITQVFTARGIHGAPEFDAEARRVVAAMPKWSPGLINDKPVRVRMVVPVRFILE